MSVLEQALRTIIAEEVAAAESRIRENLQSSLDRDLDFRETLEYLHMSEYSLRRLCREKKIPHRIYGTEGSKNPRYWFSLSSLSGWKREQEQMNYRREVKQIESE